MEIKMKQFCIVFFMFICGSGILTAQAYKLPPVIDPVNNVIIRYSSPDVYHSGTYIRIWGWSNTGKVAYSTERFVTDGRGGINVHFIIMSLITDEILFSVEIDSFDFEDPYGVSPDVLYNNRINAIIESMRTNGIIEQDNAFLRFPIRIDNFEYTSFAEVEILRKAEYYDPMIRYNIIVSRSGRRKIIKSVSSTLASSVQVYGYFKSPYENRILVITGETKYVFEGSEVFYNFIGCHLGVGFN